MSAKGRKKFYLVVRLFVMLLCSGLFVTLMNGIWKKFIGKETMVTVKLDVEDISEKYSPCVTACPFSAFKRPGKV